MAEFSSLNGYQVKDTVARGIAKGRNQAVAFVDYATMIETLNEFEKDEYKAGQNVYIGVVGVPDLWVYGVEDIRHTFTYTSDEDFVEMLKNNTTVQVGFFKLAMLEGQKVDLTTYDQHLAKHDDDIAGLNSSLGGLKFGVDENGNYGYIKAGADSVTPFKTTQLYNLGTGTSIDIKSKFPDIYTSLSINNFIVAYNSITVSTYYYGGGTTVASGYSASTTKNANLNITKSYNNSTGILTISGISNSVSYYPFSNDHTHGFKTTSSATVNVYLIMGSIESE